MKKGSQKPSSLRDDDVLVERRLGRRSSIALVGAGVLGAGLLGVIVPEPASAQCSDRDPYDPVGRGRSCSGCSDRDPYDPGGRGRHCGGGGGGGCRGISDSDPYDPAGCGRRSCSDRDPYDPGGAGRHC